MVSNEKIIYDRFHSHWPPIQVNLQFLTKVFSFPYYHDPDMQVGLIKKKKKKKKKKEKWKVEKKRITMKLANICKPESI